MTIMNDDELFLLISFLIYWLTFLFLGLKAKRKKLPLVIHLTIHIIYSSYFLYGLFFKSQGKGTALAWWFNLLLILYTHWIIHIGQLIYLYAKSKKQ